MYTARISALLLSFLCLTLTGCLEIDNDYTLNPDGTGRVDVRMRFDLSALPPESIPVDEGVKDFARNLVTQSTGIEVWSDVKSTKSEAGVIVVSGRGYFRNLDSVSLDGSYPIGFSNVFGIRGKILPRIVAYDLEEAGPGDTPGSGTDSLGIDDETGTVDIVESQLEELRIIGPEMLSRLGQRITFIVPGAIAASRPDHGFRPDSVNRATMHISGSRMLGLIDSVSADSAFRHQYRYAKKFPWSRLLFGEYMPDITYEPDPTPLFDYQRETAAAKKRYPQLRRELGIED